MQRVQSAEPERFALQIPLQELTQALQELARQSGAQIIFFSRTTEGHQGRPLNGTYSVSEALSALLAESGLKFRAVNPRTYEILPADGPDASRRSPAPAPLVSEPEQGEPNRPAGTLEEVLVMGRAEGLVATRIETPLREIPQTLSIVSAEQMRQQNDADISDAMQHATGVTVRRSDSFFTNYYVRGYQVSSYHVDGGAALPTDNAVASQFVSINPDLSEYDHIEILRGADGLFGSNSDPGATISLVRKRPLAEPQLMFSAAAGSWDDYRAEADITGPLLDDGSLRGRMVAVYRERGYFYPNAQLTRERVFGALEYDLDPTSTMILGGSYEHNEGSPFSEGLPVNADGSDAGLSRDTDLTFDWADFSNDVGELYFQIWKHFGNDWKIRMNTSAWRARVAYARGFLSSVSDPDSGDLLLFPGAVTSTDPNIRRQYSLDVTLTGSYDLFGRRGELACGIDLSRSDYGGGQAIYVFFEPPAIPFTEYHSSLYPDPRQTQEPFLRSELAADVHQTGLFAASRYHLSDDWSIVAGARVSHDRAVRHLLLRQGELSLSIESEHDPGNLVTPYGATLYDLSKNLTLYASYSSIYRAIDLSTTPDGSLIGPGRGTDVQLGIKGSWADNAVNAALVLYRINQYHIAVQFDGDPAPGVPISNCCFRDGTNRSKGIDLELGGSPLPGWLINAGYTYNINEAAAGEPLFYGTPKHLFKLWSSWRLPGELARWSVGGDLHIQSRTKYSGADYRQIQGGYSLIGLRLGYEVDANWQMALSVNNLADERYFETTGGTTNGNWFGEPRSVLLRVDARY
jgi:outer membrane receptor for ferric coprogen and ferric-rhodotorulic acid